MPIETFSAFVAEQAVGLAVGVTAVVIAPRVLPRLAKGAEKAKELGARSAEGSLAVAAVTAPPLMAGGKTIYKGALGGLHWYEARWEELFSEAQARQASRSAQSEPGAANIVISLAAAPAISDLPGRLRLKLKQIQGNQQLADNLTKALETIQGVEKIRISLASGSVLILYDPNFFSSAQALRQTISGTQTVG